MELWESLGYASQPNASFEWQEKAQLLIELYTLISTKGSMTFDEADSLFHCKYQVNFTIGEDLSPPEEIVELISSIYKHIITDPFLSKTIRLFKNEQHLMTSEEKQACNDRLLFLVVEQLCARGELAVFDKNDLINYCKGEKTKKNQEIFQRLQELYKNSDEDLQRRIRQLGALKYELNASQGLLKMTLEKNTDSHYGLSKLHPNIGYAITFKANNTPNEGTQAADYYETCNKTMQTVLSSWKSVEQTKNLIQYLRKTVNRLNEKGRDDVAQGICQHFLLLAETDLFQSNNFQEDVLDNITSNIDKNLKVHPHAAIDFIDFTAKVSLGTQLKVYKKQLNSMTQDLQEMPAVSHGYTGTLGSQYTFSPKLSCIPNNDTDKKVTQAILSSNPPVHTIHKTTPYAVLQSLYKNHPQSANMRAYIDCGTTFKGMTNQKVSESMLNYFEDHLEVEKKGVLFWDDVLNRPTIIVKEKNEWRLEVLVNTSREELEKSCATLGIKLQELFVYFDENHIVGSDIFFEKGARAFISVNVHTQKDKLLQGAMRMRGLTKNDHFIEFVVQDEEGKVISNTLGTAKLEARHLLVHSGIYQFTQEMDNHYDALRHMLARMAKRFLRKAVLKDIGTTNINRWKECYKAIRPLIEQSFELDAFIAHGEIFSETMMETALENYCSTLLSKLKTNYKLDEKYWTQLESKMKKLIGKMIKSNCLHDKVDMTANVIGQDVNQERKQEINKEQKQNKEINRELRVEQNMNDKNTQAAKTIPWPEGDIFNSSYSLTNHSLSVPMNTVLSNFNFSTLIDNRIYTTENFLIAVSDKKTKMFDSLQKPIYEILVINENNEIKLMILSAAEAAFFKNEIIKNKKHPQNNRKRELWLVQSNGAQIVESITPWNPEDPNIKPLLFQTLLLSGNIRALNDKKEEMKAYIQVMSQKISDPQAAVNSLISNAVKRSVYQSDLLEPVKA